MSPSGSRDLLEVHVPEAILRFTDGWRFDAPEIPDEDELAEAARVRGAEKIWAELGQESSEMNTRCETAAPVSGFVLATAAFLADSGHPLPYVVVAILAGCALFAAVTGLSVRVGKPRIGLAEGDANFAQAITAAKRKEAYARVASGLAGAAIATLGVAAIYSWIA